MALALCKACVSFNYSQYGSRVRDTSSDGLDFGMVVASQLAFQAQRQQETGQSNGLLDQQQSIQNHLASTSPEEMLEHLVEEIDDVLLESWLDLDYGRAWAVAIAYNERVDKLLARATARRNKRYRASSASACVLSPIRSSRWDNPSLFPELERMAMAICNGDSNPLLFERAMLIAENEIVLRSVDVELAVIERLRDPTARPL
jgi:hypothetical protein